MRLDADKERVEQLVAFTEQVIDCRECPVRNTKIDCPAQSGVMRTYPCRSALFRYLQGLDA